MTVAQDLMYRLSILFDAIDAGAGGGGGVIAVFDWLDATNVFDWLVMVAVSLVVVWLALKVLRGM